MRRHKHAFDQHNGICPGCGIHWSEYIDVVEDEFRALLKGGAALQAQNRRLTKACEMALAAALTLRDTFKVRHHASDTAIKALRTALATRDTKEREP